MVRLAFIAASPETLLYRSVSASAQRARDGFDFKMVNETQMQRVRDGTPSAIS